jgi:hypothetical protein
MIPQDRIDQARSRIVKVVSPDVSLKRNGKGLTGLCPFHQERTPSFYVFLDSLSYHCFGCGAHGDAISYLMHTRRLDFHDAVAQLIGVNPKTQEPVRAPEAKMQSGRVTPSPSAYIADLWATATDDRLTELYLYSRGIRVRPRQLPWALRGTKACWCSETRTNRPAVLAALQGEDGAVCAIQRVWVNDRLLVEDGVAPEKGTRAVDLETGKKTLGSMGSAAVRLAEPGPILGLAEGVETAMAAAQLFSVPVWAACGASRLGSIRLPNCVRSVVIFGDSGAAGEASAEKACATYSRRGYGCQVEIPPDGDWCEYLVRTR